MKKRLLLLIVTLLSVLVLGCSKQELIKMVETPDVKGETKVIKRENIGEYIFIKKVEDKDIVAENDQIKIKVKKYILNELKPNVQYQEHFRDYGIVDLDRVTILDIECEFENISNDDLELDTLEAVVTTNTGEESTVLFDFYDGQDKNILKFSKKETKKGGTTAILNTEAEDIESFQLVYDSIVLNLEF